MEIALGILVVILLGLLIISYFRREKIVKESVEKRTVELRGEKAKLQAAISAITGLIVIVDDKGKVILSNNKFSEVLGVNYEPVTLLEIQQILVGHTTSLVILMFR